MKAAVNRDRSHQHNGYVLLVVLVAIIVSTVALSRLALLSSHEAVDAISDERALQQRWANRTCAKVVLKRIGRVLEERDEALGRQKEERPPAIFSDGIVLGSATLTLIAADEQAKPNLNALYHATDKGTVERELQRTLSPGAVQSLQLSPAVQPQAAADRKSAKSSLLSDDNESEDEDDEPDPLPAFRSWGEVFNISQLRQRFGSDRELASLSKFMTLWGGGKLNVVRASDDAILSVCRPIVQDGLAKRIVDRIRRTPETGIKLILEKEVVNARDRLKLRELLGEASGCFSVWIEAETPDGRERFFSVVQSDAEGTFRTTQFRM